jgi:superfamily II DNA/RNA helicase
MKTKEKAYLSGRTKFKDFPIREEVLDLLEAENFRRPTVVQADSLPITLQESLKELCIIIYAYNGAGKTLAFLIPILNSLEMIPYEHQQKGRKESK